MGGEELSYYAYFVTKLAIEIIPFILWHFLHSEACPGEVKKIEGKRGVFIEGQITPAIPDVVITIVAKDNPNDKIEVTSNDKGSYR